MSFIIDPYRFGVAGSSPSTTGYDFNPNDYMELASAPVTAVPATIFAWVDSSGTGTEAIVAIGDSAGSSRLQLDKRSSGSDAGAVSVNSGGTSAVASNSELANNVGWQSCTAIFTSITSRTMRIGGISGTTSTASNTVSGLNSILIGARYASGSRGAYFTGGICHVAVWDIALSSSDIALLEGGANPQSVQLANLKFYAPLIDGTPKDLISGNNLTNVGASLLSPGQGPTVAGYP